MRNIYTIIVMGILIQSSLSDICYNSTSPSGCRMCSDNICTLCGDGYFEYVSGCSQCGSNCRKCTDNQNCIECYPEYYVFQSPSSSPSSSCKSCPSNCIDCVQNNDTESPLSCTRCSSSYYPIPTSSSTSPSYSCAKCSDKCNTCKGSSSSDCTSCASNYRLVRWKCIRNGRGDLLATIVGGIFCSLIFAFCCLAMFTKRRRTVKPPIPRRRNSIRTHNTHSSIQQSTPQTVHVDRDIHIQQQQPPPPPLPPNIQYANRYTEYPAPLSQGRPNTPSNTCEYHPYIPMQTLTMIHYTEDDNKSTH